MADAALDGEVVCLGTGPPGSQFGEGQACAEDDDGEGPLAASRGCGGVVRFRLRC